MIAGTRPRLARLAAAVVALLVAGGTLTACGASAGDLARASCVHVNDSIKLLDEANHTADGTTAASLRQKAYLQLLAAIPIAAQAAYHDITWEALSATLSEANRVPESELVTSLRSQCQAADSSVFNQPPPPSNPAGG